MKYPFIAAHFAGARHGFEIKTGILTVSSQERTNSEPGHREPTVQFTAGCEFPGETLQMFCFEGRTAPCKILYAFPR